MSEYLTFRIAGAELFRFSRSTEIYQHFREFVPFDSFTEVRITHLLNAIDDIRESITRLESLIRAKELAMDHLKKAGDVIEVAQEVIETEEHIKEMEHDIAYIEQIYKIQLTDYATPGFVTINKTYFGTLDDIAALGQAAKKQTGHDVDGLIKAYQDFLAKRHSEGTAQDELFVPVQKIKAVEIHLPNIEWEHKNIYGWPYCLKADSAVVSEILVGVDNTFVRCVKPRFVGLFYGTPADSRRSKLTSGFWGFPGMVDYDKEQDLTFSRMFVIEKSYSSFDEAIQEFGEPRNLIFDAFCDDIFGDG